MPASLRTTSPHGGWNRAFGARQALLVSAGSGAERLTESSIRLDRSYERLDQSGRRVSRGQQRRQVATGQAPIT